MILKALISTRILADINQEEMSDSTPVAKTIEFKVKNEAGSLMNALQVFSVSFKCVKSTFNKCS